MKSFDLLNLYGTVPPSLALEPGMVMALFTDCGMTGPCGGGAHVHNTSLFVFKDYDSFREWAKGKDFRKGYSRPDFRWWVIGDYGSSHLTLNIDEDLT